MWSTGCASSRGTQMSAWLKTTKRRQELILFLYEDNDVRLILDFSSAEMVEKWVSLWVWTQLARCFYSMEFLDTSPRLCIVGPTYCLWATLSQCHWNLEIALLHFFFFFGKLKTNDCIFAHLIFPTLKMKLKSIVQGNFLQYVLYKNLKNYAMFRMKYKCWMIGQHLGMGRLQND